MPFVVDTSRFQTENLNVPEDMRIFREKVTSHFQDAFQSIPEYKISKNMELGQYMRQHPESVIFIPQKDLHLFPVVVEEAERFSKEHHIEDLAAKPTIVRDHEFEHIQKAWELGVSLRGVGFVLFKKNGGSLFGGFVAAPSNEQLSILDQIKLRLAPNKPSKEDWSEALKIILGSGNLSELLENITNQELLLVISDKVLPKPISNSLAKLMEKS